MNGMSKIRLLFCASKLSTAACITLSVNLFFLFNIQPAVSQKASTQQGLWNKIFQPTRNPKPPVKPRKGGSRPTQAVCMISPDAPAEPRVVWNTQPLFIWNNGESKLKPANPLLGVKKIAVADGNFPINNPPENPQYLSTQIVTGKQHIAYQGQVLKPGQSYVWFVFLSETSTNPMMQVPFKIMDAQQRDRITKEIRLIEKLQQNQKASPEAIAFAKTKYFAEKQLWSDALQQAYSIANPSQELSQLQEDLPRQLCSTGNQGRSGKVLRYTKHN
ncbi:hypothetical protein Cal6303_2510 [Calothrix sp. PCC 6303]|nr:hypothetical protein Cal6303_2510 [Calothrix sp. PCC 6303]